VVVDVNVPPPFTAQVTPAFAESLVTVTPNVAVVPTLTELGAPVIVTVIAGAATIVKVTELDFVVSVIEVAVTVTVAGDGTVAGAA
jgi:hypothetical protein